MHRPQHIFSYLWHLVNPALCPMCGHALMRGEDWLCDACIEALPRTEEGAFRGNRIEQLFSGDDKFIRGAAFCFYPSGHPFREAIHALKFDSQPEVGYLLGRMAAEEWAETSFFEGIDYLVPLPLHPKRERQRGYNQAEWIARGISEQTHIPISSGNLYRITDNAHQSKRTLEERQDLEQIFAVHDPALYRNKHLLLIDDVVTSGTTMRRAIEVLHPIYRCHYSVFSLAIAHN